MNTKLRYTSSNIVEIIVVILILAVVNYLGYKFFHRFDMTENREYTISQATKSVLAGLDDPVSVELFMSGDLPPILAPLRDDVTDRLAEYVAYSKGNFKLRVTDPGDNEEEKQRAQQDGVRENQIQVTQHDELSVQNVFFGLVMKYEDKSEVLSLNELTDIASLEYGLTSKLVKLTQDVKPKVGLFVGTFTPGQQQQQQGPTYDGIRQIMAGAEGMYEIVTIDGQGDTKLPEDLDGLILAGTFGLSDSLKYSIDQFIMNGGQVFIAVDPMMQAQQQGGGSQAFPSLPTIEDQLEKYGVRFNKQLVADMAYAGQASIPAGIMTIIRDYYLWPEIVPTGFNEDVGAVSQLESLVVPWCCPLTEVPVDGVDFVPVATTSADSFTIASPFDLNPDQDWALKESEAGSKGPYHVAVMLEGQIPTAFPDGPPAKPATPEGDVPPVAAGSDFDPAAHLDVSKGLGRVVVISSAMGISDGFMQRFNQNALFTLNMMDMLLMGDELLGIRSTPVTKRPLKSLTQAQQSFYRWMNILGMPVLLVLFGGLLWFLKIKRRQMIAQKYSG